MADPTLKNFAVKITSDTTDLQTGFDKLKIKLEELSVSFKTTFGIFDSESKKISKELSQTIGKNVSEIGKNAEAQIAQVQKATDEKLKAVTKGSKEEKAIVKQNQDEINKIKKEGIKAQNAQLRQQTQEAARELKNQLKVLDKEAEQFGELDVVQINKTQAIEDVQELGRVIKSSNKTTQEEIRTQLKRLDGQKIADIKDAEQKLKRILARAQGNQTQAAKEAAKRRLQQADLTAGKRLKIEQDLQRQLLRIQQQGVARQQATRQTSARRQQQAPGERRTGRIGRGGALISELGGAAQGASSRLGVLGQTLGKLGPIGIAVGAALAITVGTLLKAAAAAGKLGNEIAKIKTTINPKQFDELSGATQRLRDFSAQTGVELSELTDGMFNAASAVTAFKNDVNAGAEAVIIASKAAVGMNTDSGNLVSVMGDLANSFGINASNTEDLNFIMDTVSQTFRDGKISGDELSSTIVKAAKSTSLLSRDAKEGLSALNAMTASMTASGINATETATAIDALQNEFLDLPKATKLIEAGLGGISTEGGKVQVDFQELFESAEDDFEKYAQLLGSKRAKLAFRTLAGGGESAFLAISEGFQDVSGRSQAAFEIMQDTSEAATKRLDASFNELMISIGGSADSAITDLTNFAAEALGGLAGLFKSAEQQAAESQEAFNQSIETANSIAESITTVKDSIAAAGEVGADEAGIVADEIKNIGETAAQFKDQFPLIADNIQRIINAEGEKTVETLALLNEQLSRAQQFAESEAFLESFEGADVALESVLEKIEKVGPLGGFIADQFGSPFGDAVKFIEDGLTGLDEQIRVLSAERAGLDLTNPEDIERAKELGDEFSALASKQQQLGRSRLAIETGISTFTDKQIEQARKLAESRGLTFNIDQQMLIIRSQLTDKFGEEGQTLELINDLTKDRLDSELKISAASKDTADATEDVTKETEKSLVANEALADVLKEQVDITDEKSFISSEINDMTAEILDNETLTTDEKIAQLEEMEASFQVELDSLNVKLKGLEADHAILVLAAENVNLSEQEAAAAWDKVNAKLNEIRLLKEQSQIVLTGKGEIAGKISKTEAEGSVESALGRVGGGRGAQRAERDRQRAEKDRQKEEDKAAKEAAKAEKDRQKEIESAEKERIKLEEAHNEELKKTFDAEVEQIERSAERMRAIDDLDHERRMRQINAQQEFEDEQRKLNEERIQREQQLNDRLTQIREQQLGELKSIAQTTSGAIQDIIKSLVPLTKREQLQLTIDETDKGLNAWLLALANSQDALEDGADETIKNNQDAGRRWGELAEDLVTLRASRSGTEGAIKRQQRDITDNERAFELAKQIGASDPGAFAVIQQYKKWQTELLRLQGVLEETNLEIANTTKEYTDLETKLKGVNQGLKENSEEYEQNADAIEQADVNKVIGDQAKLAQQLGFVANEFRIISDLSDNLFTQESAENAQIFFDELSTNSLVMKERLQKMFPGDLVTNFEIKLAELNAQIVELTKSGKDPDLLAQAVVNAQSLEALIGILAKDMADMTNQMNEENLQFIKDLIESEQKAGDAVSSVQEQVNALNEEQKSQQFATNQERVNHEILTNALVLSERKKLLQQLLSTLDPEKDFEQFTAIKQEIADIGQAQTQLVSMADTMETGAVLDDQQDAIDNQKIMIEQQEELGELGSLKALKQRLDLIDEEIALAEERDDEEKDINALLIKRKGLLDEVFQKQIAGLQNIAKTSELVFDAISQVENISGMLKKGDVGGGVTAAGDLTTKIGKALIDSGEPNLATMGAVLLGVGIFTKITGKIIDLIKGKEQSAEDAAISRLKVVELQNDAIQGQIDLMKDLVALNDAAYDTSIERLKDLRKARQDLIDQRPGLDISQEDLLRNKSALDENLRNWQYIYDQKDDIAEQSNDKQAKFVRDVNKKFGSSFDFGNVVTDSDIDEVFSYINGKIKAGEADLSDLDLIIGINEDIFGEELNQIGNRIKTAEFKLKIATELEDPERVLLAQQDVIDAYATKINRALSDAEVPAQLTDLSTEGLLNFADTLSAIFGDEIPDNIIESWNELYGSIKKADEAEKDSLQSALDEQEQLIELIKLRKEAGKISAEKANKRILELLEMQRKIIEDQIAQYGLTIDLEMQSLEIQIEINRIKNEGNEEDAESNRLLTEALRKRQQLLETFRVETGGGALSTDQANRLAQSEKTIVDQLRASGASEAEIQKFLDSLPAFEKGGLVPETGAAIVHEGEYVIPANQVKEMEDQIKSFASIFAASNPTIMGTDAITQDFTRTVLENEAKNIQNNSQFNTQFGDIIINIPSGVQEPEKIAIAVKNELSNMVLGTVQRGIDQNKIDIRGKKT